MFKTKKISDYLRNLSYLSLAEMISRLFSFAIAIYLARVYGPELFGKIGFTHAITSYFFLFVNSGMDTNGMRLIAKGKNEKETITNIFFIKIFLFTISFVAFLILLNKIPKDRTTKELMFFHFFYVLTGVFLFEWYFQGKQKFKRIAISRIIKNFIYFLLVILFINNAVKVSLVIIFQIFSLFIGSFFLFYYIKDKISFEYLKIKLIKTYSKTGFFLSASFLMTTIYYNIDKVMLGLWFPDHYVGWYEVAYKFIIFALIPSQILWSVFSPDIASEKFVLFKRFKNLMLICGTFFTLFLLVGSKGLILYIFGEEYFRSIVALRILSLNVFFVYLNVLFISPLSIIKKERIYFIIIVMAALFNVVLNFILIPKYNIMGASVATLATEILVFTLGLPVFYKYYSKRKGDETISKEDPVR